MSSARGHSQIKQVGSNDESVFVKDLIDLYRHFTEANLKNMRLTKLIAEQNGLIGDLRDAIEQNSMKNDVFVMQFKRVRFGSI